MWTLNIHKSVAKRLSKIPEPERGRLMRAIDELESGPDGKDILPLTGRKDYRYRVGGWRIIIEIDEPNQLIKITDIGSRGDIYK